jgi:hypothetical protein
VAAVIDSQHTAQVQAGQVILTGRAQALTLGVPAQGRAHRVASLSVSLSVNWLSVSQSVSQSASQPVVSQSFSQSTSCVLLSRLSGMANKPGAACHQIGATPRAGLPSCCESPLQAAEDVQQHKIALRTIYSRPFLCPPPHGVSLL